MGGQERMHSVHAHSHPRLPCNPFKHREAPPSAQASPAASRYLGSVDSEDEGGVVDGSRGDQQQQQQQQQQRMGDYGTVQPETPHQRLAVSTSAEGPGADVEASLSPLRAAMAKRQPSGAAAAGRPALADRQQLFVQSMQQQMRSSGAGAGAPAASPSPGGPAHGPSRFAPLLNAGAEGLGGVPGGGGGLTSGPTALTRPTAAAGPSAKALANCDDEFS